MIINIPASSYKCQAVRKVPLLRVGRVVVAGAASAHLGAVWRRRHLAVLLFLLLHQPDRFGQSPVLRVVALRGRRRCGKLLSLVHHGLLFIHHLLGRVKVRLSKA
jgi:hypothetical protein